MRRATSHSTRSPASKPRLSLIWPKRSRSINSSAKPPPSRRAWAAAALTASSKLRRLGKPVKLSCEVRASMRCSAACRSCTCCGSWAPTRFVLAMASSRTISKACVTKPGPAWIKPRLRCTPQWRPPAAVVTVSLAKASTLPLAAADHHARSSAESNRPWAAAPSISAVDRPQNWPARVLTATTFASGSDTKQAGCGKACSQAHSRLGWFMPPRPDRVRAQPQTGSACRRAGLQRQGDWAWEFRKQVRGRSPRRATKATLTDLFSGRPIQNLSREITPNPGLLAP
jgi:hypothetical protein